MNNMIKNIRKNHITNVLKGIIPTVLFNGAAVFMLYSAFCDGFEVIFLLLALVCALFAIPCLIGFIKNLTLAINPFKSDVFKKYGTPEKIANIYREIERTIEYEDHAIIISRNYICHKNKVEILISCNDVLAVHKLVHKTNFMVDYYQLVVTDKFGQEFHFTYNKNQEYWVDNLIVRLKGKCPNAVAGYTQDERDHIRRNKTSL